MSKRFTDSEKWNKKFIRSLKPNYKLFWLYLTDECNCGGIWDVDMEVAQVKTGVKLDEKISIKSFGDKIIPVDNNTKWFIPSFIEFQYGDLSEANRAHTKAITTLRKFNLLTESLKIKPLRSPLEAPAQAPLQGAVVVVKEEVMVKEQVEEQESNFFRFQKWISENALRVSKMGEPFTINEYEKLISDFDAPDIKIILSAMHNHKNLLKNNISANLTFRNWATRRNVKKAVENTITGYVKPPMVL